MSEQLGKIEYALKQPIQYGSEKIEKLFFRKAVTRDFRSLPVGDQKIGDFLDIAAKLSDTSPGVMDRLSGADLKGVLQIVGEFMADGPVTGSASSVS